jgi:hypothetical protein
MELLRARAAQGRKFDEATVFDTEDMQTASRMTTPQHDFENMSTGESANLASATNP